MTSGRQRVRMKWDGTKVAVCQACDATPWGELRIGLGWSSYRVACACGHSGPWAGMQKQAVRDWNRYQALHLCDSSGETLDPSTEYPVTGEVPQDADIQGIGKALGMVDKAPPEVVDEQGPGGRRGKR